MGWDKFRSEPDRTYHLVAEKRGAWLRDMSKSAEKLQDGAGTKCEALEWHGRVLSSFQLLHCRYNGVICCLLTTVRFEMGFGKCLVFIEGVGCADFSKHTTYQTNVIKTKWLHGTQYCRWGNNHSDKEIFRHLWKQSSCTGADPSC
jgi:hypothetical protein